jgi:CheY-like chemotaxis protein
MADMIKNDLKSQLSEKKKRILFVVDGDASYLYYTSMLLQRLDYSIYTTTEAEEALEVMQLAAPRLVLTEVSLPRMSGIEFLKKIKQNPKTKDVPVIVYALSADPSLKDLCFREGCTAYLRKPIDPDELYAAIQKATEATPRQYVRLNACVKVVLGEHAAAGVSLDGECLTALSENGMYLSTTKLQATGTHLVATLFLGNATVRAEGAVLYSFHDNKGPMGTPGMGIKFTRIKPEDKALIKAFIKKELIQDIDRGENKT